jgi:paraquat-inducible protein B
MAKRANPALIGSFVLGGVLLAVIAVVAFGSGTMFRDTERFISFFEGSVSGLRVGAPVRFRGIDVGTVREIAFDLPGVERQGGDLRIAVIYDVDRESVESRGAAVRVDDPLDINTLMELGVRAELASESVVTGQKYIALDLDPSNPTSLEPVEGTPYPEIPTVSLRSIEDAAYRIITDLGAVPLDSLVRVATEAFGELGSLAASPELNAAIARLPGTIASLDAAIGDVQSLLAHVDSAIAPMGDDLRRTADQATATLARLDSTLTDVGSVLEGVDGTLEPGSPVLVEFERAMIELGGASRALRDLAEFLERNPSALVRGRPGGN